MACAWLYGSSQRNRSCWRQRVHATDRCLDGQSLGRKPYADSVLFCLRVCVFVFVCLLAFTYLFIPVWISLVLRSIEFECWVQCRFTSTESVRTVRDGEPRISTLTFITQLMSCDLSLSLSSVALRPQRPYGLLRTGNPGRPPPLSHSSWAVLGSFSTRFPFHHAW